jgi:hypothetical protein
LSAATSICTYSLQSTDPLLEAGSHTRFRNVAVPEEKNGFSSMATVVKDTAAGTLPAPLPDVPVHVDARPDLNAESDDSDSDFEDEELYEDILAADMEDWEYGDGILHLAFRSYANTIVLTCN